MITLLFTLSLLVSSSLLFFMQPMVGKIILPALGGTPAVWNACMLFFQAALLAGYAYADFSTRCLGVRRQSAVHIAVLLAGLVFLPISIEVGGGPGAEASPTAWLLARLLVSVALPFFVVSTSAPVFQRWYAETSAPSAHDPYFLYAASNFGSLAALLSYPLLVEPNVGLAGQQVAWSAGYVLLVALAVCAAVTMRLAPRSTPLISIAPSPGASPSAPAATPSLEAGQRPAAAFYWLLLAFVPSSYMLGVTAHITTNVAAVPLLWVVPLALYLLTFILVFARRPPLRHAVVMRTLRIVVVPLGLVFFLFPYDLGRVGIPMHLALFFLAALACHGELARRRPPAVLLTQYYLVMSIGGALGGVFNAIVAPLVFRSVVEYPVIIALACAALPAAKSATTGVLRRRALDILLPVVVCGAALGLAVAARRMGYDAKWQWITAAFVLPAACSYFFWRRPVRFAMCLGIVFVAAARHEPFADDRVLHVERNFFGVKSVIERPRSGIRLFRHGTTCHGVQRLDPALRLAPTAYYHPTGPMGDIFAALTDRTDEPRVAIVGLGVGGLAAYARPGWRVTFYEIDPAVERIARDERYFTYLRDCPGEVEVVIGDGRLKIAEAPDGAYDMIMLDAFSSDAVPTHLLSHEALQLYLTKLASGGLLVYHISNNYLNLSPVVLRLAQQEDLRYLERFDGQVPAPDRADGRLPTHMAVMARNRGDLGRLLRMGQWMTPRPRRSARLWTDQYCDILGLMRLER